MKAPPPNLRREVALALSARAPMLGAAYVAAHAKAIALEAARLRAGGAKRRPATTARRPQ